MDFPVESYSFLPGSRAILDLSYRSRLRLVSQQSRPTMSMCPTHNLNRGDLYGDSTGLQSQTIPYSNRNRVHKYLLPRIYASRWILAFYHWI